MTNRESTQPQIPYDEASTGSEIDRITPTAQPEGRLVMYQKWRDLLFLHWPVDPQAIRPLIPPQLDLDLFEGKAYVGLVPFRMEGVRPIGFPAVPRLSNFCETNVRTYVHRRGRDPGVWFFSLDAANSLAVRLARAWFHLPYHFSRMYLEEEIPRPCQVNTKEQPIRDYPILYAGVRRSTFVPSSGAYSICALPEGEPTPATPKSLEHFLVERYILYTVWRNNLLRGYVHHSPYPLQAAKVVSFSESLLAANSIHPPSISPISHFARGVDVKVFNLHSVPPDRFQKRRDGKLDEGNTICR